MNYKLLTIADITNIYNSYLPLLVRSKNDINRYAIVYYDHTINKLLQLHDSYFSNLYRQLVLDINVGTTIGAIVGFAKERTPEDKWNSDTIERNIIDKNSIHQGILRIINQEDGIPVFITKARMVGNIAPALAYYLKGNHLDTCNALNKHNFVQKNIVAKILAGKPTPRDAASCYGRWL